MSGLYNMIFGTQPVAPAVIELLNIIQPTDWGRFRDAWIEKHGEELVIRVHTRNGGGNREDQKPAIDEMRAHPWYRSDADGTFDNTYADFYFTVSPPDLATLDPEYSALVGPLLMSWAVEPVDMDKRWLDTIRALKGEA